MKNIRKEFIENIVLQIQYIYDNTELPSEYLGDMPLSDIGGTFEELYEEIEKSGKEIEYQKELNGIYSQIDNTSEVVDEYAWGYNQAILDFNLLTK